MVVFHHQDGLVSAGNLLSLAYRDVFGSLIDGRQKNGEGCSSGYVAFKQDITAALFDDAVNRGEPKTSSFSDVFGRKEGLEDAVAQFRRDAATGVQNCELHVASGRHLRVPRQFP